MAVFVLLSHAAVCEFTAFDFLLCLGLSPPPSSHCLPSLSFFSPLPPRPSLSLLSLLTASPRLPLSRLITLHTRRGRGQQAPAAVCVALRHGSACWRPPCLCLFFSPPSPSPLPLLPGPLQCSPARSGPSRLRVAPGSSGSLWVSLPGPSRSFPVAVWVLLQSAPSFLLLSSFISPPLPFVFPAPSGCCEGQKGGSRAGLPLTEVTSHCGGRRCAKTKAGSGRCHREGVQRDTRGPLRACSSDGTGLQPCAVLSPSVVSSPCTAGCRLLRPFNPTGRDTGVGCHFLLQASSRPGTEPRSSAL